MKTFKITFRDKAGKVGTEKISAETQALAVEQVAAKGNLALAVAEEQGADAGIQKRGKKVKNDEIVVFVRQFATMIDAGLPLLQCLQTLEEQAEPASAFRFVMKVLVNDVNHGKSFSEGLGGFPKIFDKLFVSMVRAGEMGGFLAEILERLAVYLESSAALARKVKSALMYPMVVMFIALLVTVLLLVKVVPTFEEMFKGFDMELPGPTRWLLATSKFLQQWYGGGLVLAGAISVLVAFKAYNNTPAGRVHVDRIKFKLPIFGILLQKIAIARFTSTLATLITSGVPIITSLGIVSEASGNEVINLVLKDAVKRTEKGEPIAAALKESPFIPRMVAKMVEVGEATGRVDQMMQRIATYYTEQVNVAVAGLTSMIEPLLILFLGVVVGGIMLAMFMPMFKMIGSLGS